MSLGHSLESLHSHLLQNPENGTNCLWSIKRSVVGGRGLFATQRIKSGTQIFVNKPLVMGPRPDKVSETFCTNCYKIIEPCHPCDVCSLLLCSETCRTSPEHKEMCEFISKNWIPKQNNTSNTEVLSRVLIYIRFLTLSKEQMTLVSKLQRNNGLYDITELDMACSLYTIPEEQVQIMKTMSAVLKINSFRVSINTTGNIVPLRGLYPLSALLNHNCVPNTRNSFRSDYSMAVIASKDIEIGDEIHTCYTGLLWSTPARRCQLFNTKHFWCKCKRCEDATEAGTKLAALKCLNKECIGILLPIEPLSHSSKWKCDNCSKEETPEKISIVHSVLGCLVKTLDLDNQLKLEQSTLEKLAKIVPFCNHIFVDLQLRLTVRLGFNLGSNIKELPESRVALKESLCRGTLRSLAALGVGDGYLRGLLLYHLHAALAERARRHPHLYEELKPEIESTIEQAHLILEGDISAPPDLKLRRKYLGPGCDKPHQERFFILDS